MERTRNVDVHDTNADHRTAGHSTADHSRDNDTPDNDTNAEGFAASRLLFAGLCTFLDGERAGALDHGALEEALAEQGRELLRQLYQDHLDLRAEREGRLAVVDTDGVSRTSVEPGHHRGLATVFGTVQVQRMAYRRRGQPNLHPADAMLNLPTERHSHGLRRLAAEAAAHGSFDHATEAIRRDTGTRSAKRQVEALATRAAADVDDFYATSPHQPADPGDILVLSSDGKGIVMRPDALRPATKAAAKASSSKLATRLSKGEKRNRKRMATVGAVYDLTPVPRTATDVLATSGTPTPAPKAANKWLTASVAADTTAVLAAVFDQAQRRDPTHSRTWVALVDGNNHQIDRIHAEAKDRGVTVTILLDFVHVLEYLWRAAWSFYPEGDPNAETWVHDKTLGILNGNASTVAAAIRRKATRRNLPAARRVGADKCADYLLHKRGYLDYPKALANGWPIATGIIEGACRHIVKDRMDITGARWGLNGAEAILKLRAVHANGDFDDYWAHHIAQERRRVHQTRYANAVIPRAA